MMCVVARWTARFCGIPTAQSATSGAPRTRVCVRSPASDSPHEDTEIVNNVVFELVDL